MKKILSALLALAITLAPLSLSACEDTPDSSASSDPHTHAFGAWTRLEGSSPCEQSIFQRVCSSCAETEERQGTYEDHVWSAYIYDVTDHWTRCTVCDFTTEKKPHVLTAENSCRDCQNPFPTECVTYELSSDETYAVVTGYDESETNVVVIAPLYDGLPVREIQADAFAGCTNLASITLPDGITAIGDNAFNGCTDLMGIYLSSSVVRVGENAFKGCTELSIFCEAENAPEGFSESWNIENCLVYWNHKDEAMAPVSYASTSVLDSPLLLSEHARSQIALNSDLNGVRAPEGFSEVYRFDGKADRWERSALWNYNFDNSDLQAYEEVWFAIKVVNGYWAFVGIDDTPMLHAPTWVYIRMKQVGMNKDEERFWDIEASFGGQVWVKINNQIGAEIDNDRKENSVSRLLWNEAFHSRENGENALLIYHNSDGGNPPTIYCTEIRATLL